jgi:methyl-accepting chemotaxis protein
MKEFIKNEVYKLNMSLEIITYFVNVPIAACFGVVCLQAYNEKFISFIIGVGFAVVITLAFILWFRTYFFTNLILQDLENSSQEEKIHYKLKLSKIPLLSGIIIQIQWLIGLSIGGVYYFYQQGFTIENMSVYGFILIILAPLNFSTHAARSDLFLKEILKYPLINQIEIPKEQILKQGNQFNNFRKIIFTIWSIVFFIVLIFLLLYLRGVFNRTTDLYKDYLLVFLCLQSLVIIYVTSNLLAKNINMNINNMKNAIQDLNQGNLTKEIAVIDFEELAIATCDLNQLRKTLKNFVIDLKTTSETLISISSHVFSNSSDLNKEAQEQASFTEEVSSSIEEFKKRIEESFFLVRKQVESVQISSEVLNLLGNEINTTLHVSNESSKLSAETKRISNIGYDQGKITQKAIEEIKLESNAIVDYSKIISDISEQVGLLSLNASIEAARAGKDGRGFAVVATEISKLGENTSQNSNQIQKKVSILSKKVSDGYDKTNQLLKSFENIVKASESTTSNLDLMKEYMNKQSSLKDQVNEKMSELLIKTRSLEEYNQEQNNSIGIFYEGVKNLSKTSEALAISSDSLYKISDKLNKESDKLKTKISFFQIN